MKKRLAVIIGGRSSEHEVSLVSGASVIEAIDTDKYDVKIVVISKEGEWLLVPDVETVKSGAWKESKVKAVISPDTKDKALLVFNEAESMMKMAPNSKYKKYLEELFRRYIGVDYTIYTLQDNQYNTLIDEIKNISPKKDSLVEIKEEQEEKEDLKNNSKIEQLFSDIIVEK